MFIGSEGGRLDRSRDSRSCAIPDGALVTCWFSLEESLVSLRSQSLRHGASTKFHTHTVLVLVLSSSDSWPSSSRSYFPYAHGWAVAISSCCTASIFGWPTDPSFAFHPDFPSPHWMRRPASQESRLHEEARCGFGCVQVRYPVCLECDESHSPTTAWMAAGGSIAMMTMVVVGKAVVVGAVGKGLVGCLLR